MMENCEAGCQHFFTKPVQIPRGCRSQSFAIVTDASSVSHDSGTDASLEQHDAVADASSETHDSVIDAGS